MTALSSLLTSARYDLRDTDSDEYTDDELVEYANRSRVQLDAALGSIDSDWVYASDTLSLTTGNNSVALPSDFGSQRSLWYSTTELRQRSVNWIIVERNYTSSGQPYNWAIQGTNVIVDREADTDYSLTLHYNSVESTWATSSTMPYNDEFNLPLIKMIVLQAKQRNEYDVLGDNAMYDYFRAAAMEKVIRRKFVPKPYRLDF
jgi:hypothetical protein